MNPSWGPCPSTVNMKVIIINDSDGHCWGMKYTTENVEKVRQAAIESGVFPDDLPDNELPLGRVFGNICEVIDTDNLKEFPNLNPFM